MEYKKTIILLMLTVFLLSITCVNASEIDNAIVSEDANTIELSNDIIEDNLQTSEENDELTLTDTDVLGADSATYSDLAREIEQPGNIKLTHKNYTYDDGADVITITENNKVIDGDGAVIDMKGSTIRAFEVNASDVIIKNLTIKNVNYNNNGGAIYFNSSGIVTDCNFTNNKVTSEYSCGGAIWMDSGIVTDCNFADNTANWYGGAVYFNNKGTVTDCNFAENTARYGGAVSFHAEGVVTYCNFTDNTATTISGGAVYFNMNGTVSNCDFVNNSAPQGGALRISYRSTVMNSNFVNNTATEHGGAFYGQGQGTVINCNFTGNSANNAGALHLNSGGTVEYCNFVNNTASVKGGAAYLMDKVNLNNCNFTNNTAGNCGAAYLDSSSNVTDCNFINNSAVEGDAGAIYFNSRGNVTNCNFNGNTASGEGGAVYSLNSGRVAVDTCIFKTPSDTTYQTINLPPTLDVDDFTTIYGSGEKLTFYLKTNRSIPVNNGNIFISVYNKNNNTLFGNYSCISGEGWTVDLPVGSYYAIFNTEYAEFESINRTITIIPETSFWALNDLIHSTYDSVVNLNNDFYFDPEFDAEFIRGIEIYPPVKTINGNGHIINANGKARIFLIFSNDAVLENITFINGYTNFGVIDFSQGGNVLNCNFVNNSASVMGGAIFFSGDGTVASCNFVNNSASIEGGAICFEGGSIFLKKGNITDSNFTGNDAKSGGAISTSRNLNISDSNFKDNTATDGSNNIILNGDVELILNNVTPENFGPIYKGNMEVINVTNITYGDTAKITVKVTDAESNPVNSGTVSVIINGKEYSANVTNGTATIEMIDVDVGSYDVNVTYHGAYAASSKNVKFTVSKQNATILASAKSYVINYGGKYSVTLKDAEGRLISGQKVTFTLNGKDVGSAVSDVNGVATITLTAKILKAAKAGSKNLVVKFTNTNYNPVSKTVKITVNKEKTKITAKKKTFKKSVKVKKYTITLKNSKGKAVKKVKVTLKIKGKTYKAKTNSKGKATFKIKKLTKKGTFKAKINFKATGLYLKSAKTVIIRIK